MSNTTVIVEIKVSIRVSDSWGDDCTIGQLKKQAKVSAVDIINRSMGRDPLVENIAVGTIIVKSTLQ